MITLRSMTEAEYNDYLEPSIVHYARDHVEAGTWTEEESLEKARKEFQDLLPNGLATPNHYLFTLVNEEQQKVGMLWFALRGPSTAFVYDVAIDGRFRRLGYGSQAFLEMENKVLALGATRISLHVFGNNQPALNMYKQLGYETTNVLMAKKLDRL